MCKVIKVLLFGYLSISIVQADSLKVRDSQTGALIDAEILIQSIDANDLTTEDLRNIKLGKKPLADILILNSEVIYTQKTAVQLSPGSDFRLLTVSADGYKTLQTYINANSNVVLEQIMLDQSVYEPKSRNLCEDSTLCGYIYDKNSGMPLRNVAISVNNDSDKTETYTDDYGLFYFSEKLPETIEILIQQQGYQSQLLTEVGTGSSLQMVIELDAGSGIKKIDMTHPLKKGGFKDRNSQWVRAKLSHQPSEYNLPVILERSSGAVYLEPPASIRVGFSSTGGTCCGSNCSTSQVYSLETYVQRGLDNEWISSWDSDSLKAGSIPYRSYGAWHVINGTYPGYDICAGPCCQAFGYTGYSSTMNAAAATNGIMLDLNGELARSEYSAQNNSWDDPNDGLSCTNVDLSCGNGYVGSPSAGWPCLSDSLSSNHGCFGHGRGMSQWGTQYQALNGSSFADIVDFYYNANNNPSGMRSQFASTPIRLNSIAISGSVINQNELLTIYFNIFNSSDTNQPFGPVLLGASLYDGVAYFSDLANDVSTTVNQAGVSVLDRPFQLDASVLPGIYDLITALYLDVDGNNQISSADWLLQVYTQTGALEVLEEGDLIFRDGFEL
ncbi:MAG: SpoIID/LytB domain-containing protein [Gammaproteobacteria bacterium]|jgi:hypothetical protein